MASVATKLILLHKKPLKIHLNDFEKKKKTIALQIEFYFFQSKSSKGINKIKK